MGKRLRRLRQQQHLTVAQLAARCGAHRSEVRDAERGIFDWVLAVAMAIALDAGGPDVVGGLDAWNGMRDMDVDG